MTPKHLYILLLALVATSAVAAQGEDAIPVETDNQFPLDREVDPNDILEGSGTGALEEPPATEDTTPTPQLEEVQSKAVVDDLTSPPQEDKFCPSSCVCNLEGDDFVVNCAGYGLTEFPSSIHPRTTKLIIDHNKLTEIPKEVSSLKNLKELNANNNELMEISPGSISELPELKVLKLANNRLIEYPTDLKNSFGLTKLEELDLGGNDMRTTLSAETFSSFNSLIKLTLPTSTQELLDNLCHALQNSLEQVCTDNCDKSSFDCANPNEKIDEDLTPAVAGLYTADIEGENSDPGIIGNQTDVNPSTEKTILVTEDNQEPAVKSTDETVQEPPEPNIDNVTTSITEANTVVATEISTVVNAETSTIVSTESSSIAAIKTNNAIIENAEVPASRSGQTVEKQDSTNSEVDVKIGAATTDVKTGGVDKSVIGIIVAAMVVIVAGIVIKKNWSSIRKRFSSSPRPNDRTGAHTNGTTPEEVPLQEKSPV